MLVIFEGRDIGDVVQPVSGRNGRGAYENLAVMHIQTWLVREAKAD